MITSGDEIDIFGDKIIQNKSKTYQDRFKIKNIDSKHITKEQLQNLLENKSSKKIQETTNIQDYTPEIMITESPITNITTTSTIYNQEQSSNKNIDMNKWWNSYLAIPNKVEYSGHGADYSNLNDTSSSGLAYYVNEFCNNVPVEQYPKVLDIGAGNGGETKVLINKGYNVIGITMGIDNVKMAKETYIVDILNMDMNHLDFEINSFDAVMMIQTFEHFLSPFIACIELWRVLKINGLCYLDVPCPKDLPMWSINHTNLLYEDQITNMFSMCGFELVKQLSKKNEHRIRLIFKKLSISKIRNWEQLRYIHLTRDQVFY